VASIKPSSNKNTIFVYHTTMDKELKRILIISYFFPPANIAGIFRVFSWAKYLNKFGWYPVIVTRTFNTNQVDITDVIEKNELTHEKNDSYEVYRLPYNRSLRDKLVTQSNKANNWFGKILTLWEIFSSGFSNKWVPYNNLYDFADELLTKDKSFKCILVSGRPFLLFKFAYLLSKKHNIPRVVDYRDEWNTHQWVTDETWRRRIINTFENRREKKWVKGAALVTTCSEEWSHRIGKFTNNKNVEVIYNGYDEDDFKNIVPKESDNFTIVHSGTLYATQNVKIFNEGLKLFRKKFPEVKIIIQFPGITYSEDQTERVKEKFAWLGTENVIILDRIPKQELLSLMAGAKLLIMFGVEYGIRGHHSSKIFEYLRIRVPILLSPSDCDVMEDLIKETNTGVVGYSVKNVADLLEKIYFKKYEYAPYNAKVENYSRMSQAEKLAAKLDEYIK
jgi:glycosyltransferase involved in cell wall biosynthesis